MVGWTTSELQIWKLYYQKKLTQVYVENCEQSFGNNGKKIRKRYTCLRKLGISHRDAYVTANSRKGYYYIAHTRVIETAISKERLNKSGLVNSLDHYLKVHTITN